MRTRQWVYVMVAGIMAVWMFTIHRFELSTAEMVDSVGALGSTIMENSGIRGGLAGQSDGVNSVQFFILVGRNNCPYTTLADGLLDRMVETYPSEVMKYKWTASSKKEFDDWVSARKTTQQVPDYHTTSPVVFLRIGESRKFLGGATQLLEYVRLRFPDLDISKEVVRKGTLDDLGGGSLGLGVPSGEKATPSRPIPRPSPPPSSPSSSAASSSSSSKSWETTKGAQDEYEDEEKIDSHLRGDGDNAPEDAEPPVDGDASSSGLGDNPEQVPVAVAASQEVYMQSPYNRLEPQIALRKKSIVTTYRITEKRVTNYRPMIQFLRDRGWSNIPMAPLLATWILVQDQKTAAYVLSRYSKAIVNNIGYGGQSCFGGTKGYQLRCRSEFAKNYGCEYDDLNVQPPQYRLWEEPECRKFFDQVCLQQPAAMWIEKPSGGQHGAGMRVHQGCDKLRDAHAPCRSTGKKYIAMPYLSPALLGGHKFDVRSYLLIASLDPLLVFYHDGFARKAGSAYSSDTSDVNAHITNAESQSSTDHFYEFSRLEETLHRESGFPADYMRRVFREHAIRVQRYVFHASRQTMKLRKKGVYQIFALDWIIDDDGGIHMLEANSNPLVTVYKDMATEFTETWDSMVDLVLKVQTAPASLFSREYPELVTKPPERRFRYRGWQLMFSELEEQHNQETFNPCNIGIKPYSVKAEGKQFPVPSSGAASPRGVATASDPLPPANSARQPGAPVPAAPEPSAVQGADAGGGASVEASETPYRVSPAEVRAAIAAGASRKCEPLDFVSGGGGGVFRECTRIDRELGPDDEVTRCSLGEESYFYVIEPTLKAGESRSNCYPIIMVTAGVHGNEHSGIVAANYIRRKWSLKNARLVVVERLNARSVGKGRYIPKVAQSERDLNRNFPASGPVGTLAKQIWSVVSVIRPHIFIDLHEGWGVYNRLKGNKGGPLVGNPSFSKGSSIISSEKAQPIAKFMINKVNELTVPDVTRHFLSIVPPISTGLASMIDRNFASLVMVSETTSKGQPLYLRAQQQLVMVGACVTLLGLVPKDFDARQGFDASQACLAGSTSCALAYPNDAVYISEEDLTSAASAAAASAFASEKDDDDQLEVDADNAQYGEQQALEEPEEFEPETIAGEPDAGDEVDLDLDLDFDVGDDRIASR